MCARDEPLSVPLASFFFFFYLVKKHNCGVPSVSAGGSGDAPVMLCQCVCGGGGEGGGVMLKKDRRTLQELNVSPTLTPGPVSASTDYC